ncbi:MAG: hypothetical protein NW206_00655 [Hyphomonadaceae bacterium]|nr:hypothetical protein [Hyphomonadaceae bacterium]
MKLRGWVLAGAVVAPCFGFETAQAQTRVSFASGVDYSTGDYGGSTDTELVSIPLAARISIGTWSFRASVPLLSVTGPADVSDEEAGGGGTARTGTETGLGDTTLSVTRAFRNIGDSDFFIDVTGRVRAPTGDEERGLGVGVVDYTAQAQAGVLTRRASAYATLGRRFLGDPDAGLDRQDGWLAAIGGWVRAGEKTRVGASYTWRNATYDSLDDPSELGGFVSYRASDAVRVSFNLGAGLSDSSPDFRAGLRFTFEPDLSSGHD